jgi:dipeptide/tripeptide permease
MQETLVNIGIWSAIILVAIAVLAAVILPLINSLSHPKTLIKSGIGVAFVGVIFLIGWILAGSEVMPTYAVGGITDEGSSKLVGGALTAMYILFILAIVGIIFTEIKKAFR